MSRIGVRLGSTLSPEPTEPDIWREEWGGVGGGGSGAGRNGRGLRANHAPTSPYPTRRGLAARIWL